MGGVVSKIIHAMSCSDLAKYVCNAMDIESECCHQECMCHVHTEPTEVKDSRYEFEIDTEGLHFVKN